MAVTTDVLKLAKSLFGRSGPEAKPASVKKAINPFHAVSIAPGLRACAAARALRDRRFLSREAPILPLKACDSTECTCRYEHHDDRRKGHRRARDLGVSIDGYEGDERRVKPKRGRRKADT
jgi:hypothetical protein